MLLASGVDGISTPSCTLCMKMASLCSPVVKGRCSVKHISINLKRGSFSGLIFSRKKHPSALLSISELLCIYLGKVSLLLICGEY